MRSTVAIGCLSAVALFAAMGPVSWAAVSYYRCYTTYSTLCLDLFNWFSCTKTKSMTCKQCASGYTGEVDNDCPIPTCFQVPNYCPNGGTCSSPNNCINCNTGFYSPACAECTSIDNCLTVSCQTSSDQICVNCDGDFGPSDAAYRKSSDQRRCIKQCSWRDDSTACYPGTCDDCSDTECACTCSEGFSGADCRTLGASQAPTLSGFLAELVQGTTKVQAPSPVGEGSQTNVFTNVPDFASIRVAWLGSYQPGVFTNPSAVRHDFIHSSGLGIVGASVSARVDKAGGGTYEITPSVPCSTAGSDLSPEKTPVDCERSFDLDYDAWTPVTGDVLRYDVSLVNGGYLKLHNRDHANTGGPETYTRYYSGRTVSDHATFTFDLTLPSHCLGVSCRSSMLDAGPDVTSQASVSVTWSGWADDLAGISEYDLEVRQLSGLHGDEMTESYDVSAVYTGPATTGHNVTLPHVGVYSFVLGVVDNAGNVQRARRFVFLDDDPDDVTVRSGGPLRVDSATAETDYQWLTSLAEGGGGTPVSLVWTGHFANEHHLSQGMLKPIASYSSADIESDYDQNFGRRGRAAIAHALGVTEFRVWHDIDHSGGRTTAEAGEADSGRWAEEGAETAATYGLELVDGDSVRFWVEARDLAGHSANDSVLAHADSSPPVLENLWLVRDGEVGLAVHNSADLHEMSVEFRTYDIHSGVRTIEWRLFDNHTESEIEHGHQTVPARKINTDTDPCLPVSCMCVPIGDCYAVDYGFSPAFHVGVHDYDYYITVTVTNHARLVTTQTVKITVDTSAPQTGAVHDGLVGAGEVDFQQSLDLTAHWDGFFDRESGVKFYRYLFGPACLDDPSALDTVRDSMTRTTSTHASWTAPSAGRYFVTVVAYNRALEPSVPVCSDGVVVDTSPPVLSQVVVGDCRMWPGLAVERDGDLVWYLDRYRRRVELLGASSPCRSKATVVDDVSVYPERVLTNLSASQILQDIGDCDWIAGIQEKYFLPTHKHVNISWFGEDSQSSIYDYEIGLSSDPSNPTPDLLNFRSSSGHSHHVMYHPHLGQGSSVYLVLRAVNRAQLSTTKVIGPILVDTTPPVSTGSVSVRTEDGYLVADWGDGDFLEDMDGELQYDVGIGSSLGGTETLSFQSRRVYQHGPCLDSRATCAAFSADQLPWRLHADHEYYVTVRATNGAGLSAVETSPVHRHAVQLPTGGVVLDLSPSPDGTADEDPLMATDIDVQGSTSSIAACWFGFEHSHLDVAYEFGVGSADGHGGTSPDVSAGFVDVGNATCHRLDTLELHPLRTYYVTVRARSAGGSVTVSSDGVRVIPDGQVLDGAIVQDGLGCQQAGMPSSVGLSHHSPALGQPCEEDTLYQSSTSDVAARWTVPGALQPYVTNVLWAVQQETGTSDEGERQWATLIDEQDLGMAFHHVESGLGLLPGAHYRSKVRFCHTDVCFEPLASDGFWVLSRPPAVGMVTVRDVASTQGATELRVRFQPFVHDYGRHDDQGDPMDFYEWSIAEDGQEGALLNPWTRIDDLVHTDEGMYQFTATYGGHLEHDACLLLSVRGYSRAGLSSVASAEIRDCDDVTQVAPHLVIDADYGVSMEQNAAWPLPDTSYVLSVGFLAAVWPTLRHRAYRWAVVEDAGSTGYGDLDTGLRYPCQHPRAKACGETDKEFVNVFDLHMEQGKRYRVCVRAEAATRQHEVWTETLPSVAACSDGVVVDTTPPTPGSVWIGWDRHQTYQSSNSELVLHWESFADVEEHGQAPHHSGIRYYEYAIGSMRGGTDIHDFTRVGLTNRFIVNSDLRLQNGHMYFATIRATDFVGLSSLAVSEPVTIDTTPPDVSASHTVDVGGSFLLSTSSVTASWESVFFDDQSGIAYYEWAVGSHPGHADIMPFTREDTEAGVSDPSQPLTLQEGHSYFISVKAINSVGLAALQSFGAFLAETSPPVAGHVFDGDGDGDASPGPGGRRDRDYQDGRSSLAASWEGFHDPHSAVTGYTWQAGTCALCRDVVAQQDIGLDTFAVAEHLSLVPGLTYYVTVTACNAADLCTAVTSDGVLVDDSPPIPGRVYDGSPDRGDVSFQSSGLRVSAHWWGFHDPHSGLSHYEWRAGTSPGSEDILTTRRIELSEAATAFLPDARPLPEDTAVYITVRAFNRLGMWAEATSNGFLIDRTPPAVVEAVAVDRTIGSVVVNTQILRDVIRFSWQFADPESGIRDQYVSIHTDHNGDIDIVPIKVAGTERDHTFTDLRLHEGSHYVITVVACNAAGLCTESKADPLLVDGSPSSVGAFAIGTESAANLQRHQIIWITPEEPPMDVNSSSLSSAHTGWMTWAEDGPAALSSLALAWLGFVDVHSGVDYYRVTVGSTYGGSELTSNTSVRVNHSVHGMPMDEGIVQTAILPLEGSITVLEPPYLYISIWAVNGVGIPSGRHHSAFEISQSSAGEGALVLLRRCSPTTCKGHCACAPLDRVCLAATDPCNDITESNPNTEVEVIDTLDLSSDDIDTAIDIDHTIAQHAMGAVWRADQDKGLAIKWFEWSIGDDSSPTQPAGVFDPATERVWFDVGLDNRAVVTLDKDRKLTAGVGYHLFLRAWYDADTYAVFRSDGITLDVTHPRISSIRGTKVKDLTAADSTEDVDYLTAADAVSVSWSGLFLDQSSLHYQVSLSTYPGGQDIRRFEDNVFSAGDVRAHFTGLDLRSGVRYYSNVRAFNRADLHTLRSSDGFVVDVRAPDSGLVQDGTGLGDVEYQNSSVVVSASWHGFVDLESYLHHYEWCVGLSQAPGEDTVLPCTDVGTRLSSSKSLPVPLTTGIRYYSKVTAVDAAGLRSATVPSDGFVVDTTAPVPQDQIQTSDNLVQNPSFEELREPDNTATTVTSDENTTSEDSVSLPPLDLERSGLNVEPTAASSPGKDTGTGESLVPLPWLHDPPAGGRFEVVHAGADQLAQDGDRFLSLHGSVWQAVDTTPGGRYIVVLFAGHAVRPYRDPLLSQEGRVEAPGLNRVFRLYHRRPKDHSDQSPQPIKWHEHRFYFTAEKDVSRLTISSVGRINGILLDNIQVRQLTISQSHGQGSVDVHTQSIHGWSSVQANWHFVDPESPIVDYRWAIGTVPGGTQLQDFTSVGLQSHALNADVRPRHGTHVHVTVTARNAAELVARATSRPVLIDLTPPVIHHVTDGGEGHDIDLTSETGTLQFSWSATDEESGIERCLFGIGSAPGKDDILPNAPAPSQASSHPAELPADVASSSGTAGRLHATVTCYNRARLSSWRASDGVTVVTAAPDAGSAAVAVVALSETQYGTRDGYQSQTDSLLGGWGGFSDPFGIHHYECRLTIDGVNSISSPWQLCGSTSQTHVRWTGLQLLDHAPYALSVRAVGAAGLTSRAVTGNFTVQSYSPTLEASTITWSWLGDGMVRLDWQGVFSASPSGLVYEVSLGTLPGGSDVMQWVETMATGMDVSPLEPNTDYYLTLTAINAAGLSKTVTEVIDNL